MSSKVGFAAPAICAPAIARALDRASQLPDHLTVKEAGRSRRSGYITLDRSAFRHGLPAVTLPGLGRVSRDSGPIGLYEPVRRRLALQRLSRGTGNRHHDAIATTSLYRLRVSSDRCMHIPEYRCRIDGSH